MNKVPIWALYSWWVFGMTVLWVLGLLPFSPKLSIIVTFLASVVSSLTMYGFKPVGLFIILSHLLPLYLTKSSPLDINPNLIVFALYNLVLFSRETDIWEVYQKVFTSPPQSIKAYFIQRGLWSISPKEN